MECKCILHQVNIYQCITHGLNNFKQKKIKEYDSEDDLIFFII